MIILKESKRPTGHRQTVREAQKIMVADYNSPQAVTVFKARGAVFVRSPDKKSVLLIVNSDRIIEAAGNLSIPILQGIAQTAEVEPCTMYIMYRNGSKFELLSSYGIERATDRDLALFIRSPWMSEEELIKYNLL